MSSPRGMDMYWLITFNNGKQKVIKADDGKALDKKVKLTEVLTMVKLSDDIFVNLAEVT